MPPSRHGVFKSKVRTAPPPRDTRAGEGSKGGEGRETVNQALRSATPPSHQGGRGGEPHRNHAVHVFEGRLLLLFALGRGRGLGDRGGTGRRRGLDRGWWRWRDYHRDRGKGRHRG